MDIFNRDKIFDLKVQLEEKNKELNEINQKFKDTNSQLEKYKSLVKDEHYTIQDLTNYINTLNKQRDKLQQDINDKAQTLKNITGCINEQYLKNTCFKDINSATTYSHELKSKIISNKSAQKELIKNNKAILNNSNGIALEGNEYQGGILISSVSTLMLSSYNLQCDDIINALRLTNLEQSVNKLERATNIVSQQGNILDLTISKEYANLKIEELYLQYEYINLLHQEKEKKDREKEILKDQAKADKELAKLEEKQERELNNLKYQYNVATTKNKELQLIDELKTKIDQLEDRLNITRHKLTDNKCGYVYVISNRDMYPNQYKIGVTRREDIDKRMRELSDAGHSFIMEVNGCIWVDKVYEIETQLHQYLQDKRVNVNGTRKEWFNITLDEVGKAFKDCCGLDIELNEYPCQDYLDSKEKFEFL